MSQVYFARVKNILSADTVVLSSPNGSQERILSLAYLQAPRLQSNEKYSFESRELLRTLLLDKKIKFWVIYKTNNGREFGDISTPTIPSLIEYILSNGGARLRDNAGSFDDDDEEFTKFKIAEEKAKDSKIGIWNPAARSINQVIRPDADVIKSSVSTPIDSIVEKVISGDRLLVRLLLSKGTHSVVPVLIAGVKSPRSSSNDESGEPYGDAAKQFVEEKLTLRNIKVSLLGESSTGVLVGKIIHPAGNISEKILAEGLGEVADWQSTFIGSNGMTILRRSEKEARDAGKNLWKSYVSNKSHQSSNDSEIKPGKVLHGEVARVISGDTIVLSLENDIEVTVQLASIRALRASDPVQAPFAPIAKEYVRKKIIGKKVTATVESIREANDQFDERAMVTLRTPAGVNLGKDLVSKGYATVIRHRKGEDRPDYWDELIECETQAAKSKLGFNGKQLEIQKVVDASENAARAKPFLFSFQNRNFISAVVDHVSSGNRFKIFLPKENAKLTLVLGGLSNNGSMSEEATALAIKTFYQRDVEIQIYGVDRVGGFIGNIFVPGSKEPFQKTLLAQGLYEAHERSLNDTKFGALLTTAESEAKEKKLGVWENYDPAQDVNALAQNVADLKLEKTYLDVKVTEVLKDGTVALQIIDEDNKKLKSFMQSFHTASSRFQSLSSLPKRGELVAAKLSDNGKYYRAKVKSVNRSSNKVEVQHVDYGTIEEVSFSDLKSVSSEYSLSAYKSQAHIAQLSLVNIPPESQPEYRKESIYFLEDTLLDKQVVACVNFRNPRADVELDVDLYDPEVIATDPTLSVNKEIVEQGWGLVKKKNLSQYEGLMQKERGDLLALEDEAKSNHLGCWEFGDIEGDEEF